MNRAPIYEGFKGGRKSSTNTVKNPEAKKYTSNPITISATTIRNTQYDALTVDPPLTTTGCETGTIGTGSKMPEDGLEWTTER
jgi:hypothetical protein